MSPAGAERTCACAAMVREQGALAEQAVPDPVGAT